MTDNGRLAWTNDKRLLSDLIPWPRNPRQVKVEQVKRLQESLTEFGQPETIAIGPGNELYNGHQRLKSWADKFGDIEVDVRIASRELTEKEREKLTIFLHKGAAGEWDFDTLANEFDVDDLLDWGFDDHELDLDLWGVEPEEDPGAQIDRAEELREQWGVETGQLWRLGEHYLACGDCTDPHIRDLATAGDRVELGLHDPPYGIDAPNMTLGLGKKEFLREDFDKERVDVEWLLTESEHCIIWGGNYYADVLPVNNDWLCWDKKNPNMGYSEFELAWSNLGINTRLITHHWSGEEKQHPTQKPLPVIEWCLSLIDCKVVCDFYLGSGTTLIACERLGRKCRAVEISPAYCAVAIQRWVDMTGGEPELIDS